MRKLPASLLFISLGACFAPRPSFAVEPPKNECAGAPQLYSSLTRTKGYEWPNSLEFVIPEAQKAQALRQVDKDYLNTSYFVIPNNDGEAKRAGDILRAAQAPYVKVSPQAWGAELKKETGLPPVAALKAKGIKRLVVFEIPGKDLEELYRSKGIEVVIVDHHEYEGLGQPL